MDRTYEAIYRHMNDRPPPRQLTVVDSNADVFGGGRGFMEGFDFTLQLAVGCPAGCLFCYVKSGHRLTPQDLAQNWGFEVRYKERAVEKFRRRLDSGGLADSTIYWSGVTDPYALGPAWTRPLWEALLEAPPEIRPRRIAVQSRFRVDRDADLIGEYVRTSASSDGGPSVVISLSIGTDRNDLIRAIERAVPDFERRLRCVKALRHRSIPVVVTLSPCLLWNDLSGTLKVLDATGVSYLTVLFLKEGTRSANTPRAFLNFFREDTELSVVLDAGWQEERLAEMRALFGAGRVIEGQAGFAELSSRRRLIATHV